jgi:branched-chain amino acid transport system permease protein
MAANPVPSCPRRRALIAVGVATALLTAPLLVYPFLLMQLMCFILFACAFNLLMGYGGLASFGHAAFFGSASYVTAYAIKELGFSPELALLAATTGSAVLGLVLGSLSIRRHGIYFAMVTLAFSQMIFFFFMQAPWTGGEDGIQNVPRGRLLKWIDLSSDQNLYYAVLVVVVLALWVIYRTIHSPFGQVLRGIRDNEARAISLGYRVQRYKLAVFVLSATLAGLAGALKCIVVQIATLTDVHWSMSGEVLLMTLIGGIGTFVGPIVGATIVVLMRTELASLGEWVTVVHGLIFMACVVFFREGIVGRWSAWMQRSHVE